MTSSLVMTRALWAGPGARRALARGGSGVVEFALHPGGYARLGEEWLLLAIPRAPRGPLTLLVAGLEAAPLAAGDEVALDPGPLAVGGDGAPAPRAARDESAPLAVRYDLAPLSAGAILSAGALRIDLAGLARSPFQRADPPLAPGWRGALNAALDAAPAAPRALAAGLSALHRGDVVEGVAELAGRGEGLTPAGDDVLAGYAAWCHAQGRETDVVALASARAAPLGLAYLRCAGRGELPEPAAAVLRAIRAGDANAARRRAAGLSRWGASSGAAILWGIAAGASA